MTIGKLSEVRAGETWHVLVGRCEEVRTMFVLEKTEYTVLLRENGLPRRYLSVENAAVAGVIFIEKAAAPT